MRAPTAITLPALRIVAPEPRWHQAARRTVVLRDGDGRPQAYGWRRDGDHWIDVPGLATFRLGAGGTHVDAAPAPAAPPDLVEDAFAGTVVPLALCLAGYEALHAGAVLTPAGVVAICGFSEAGKSTTAYGLSRRGHRLWADDVVVFEAREGAAMAHPLPFSLHLRAPSQAYFGASGDAEPVAGEHAAPLAAVVLLERTAVDATPPVEVARLSLAEAVPAVLPHAFRFGLEDAERKARTLRTYLASLATVAVLRVRFRPRLEELDGLLDALESALPGGGGG